MSARALRDASAAETLTGSSRDRILDAALELTARYGITGMSLQLLADQVGLHKSTLFHHFPDKRSIIDEMTVRFMTEVVRRVEPMEHDDPPDLERFVAVAESLDDYFSEHPWTALMVMRDTLGPFETTWFGEQSAETTRFFGILAQWLDRARQAGVVRPMSVPQVIVNLMAIVLFYPALVDQFGDDFAVANSRSEEARRRRKREIREILRRALAP